MTQEFEARMREEMMYVLPAPCEEIVHAEDLVAVR